MLNKMLSVKRIIAIALTAVFCYLSVKGIISAEQFMTVFTVVVGFYYGQSTMRNAKDKEQIEPKE